MIDPDEIPVQQLVPLSSAEVLLIIKRQVSVSSLILGIPKAKKRRVGRSSLQHWCRFQILEGCQGQRTGVGVTTVSNSFILGGWVTKVLKNCNKKIGGWKGGWQQYFDFTYITDST